MKGTPLPILRMISKPGWTAISMDPRIIQISGLREYSQVFTNYVKSITDVQTELERIKEFYQENKTRWW